MIVKIYNTLITYAIVLEMKVLMNVTDKLYKNDKTYEQYNRLKNIEQSLTQFYNELHLSNMSDNARNKFIANFRRYVSYVTSYGAEFLI